ncbi:uncharacterized protein LOC131079997 [Cryptomeria japonica]|uniref:uncharacterized protein LOC131079997 n=1 Tax=Cryptomeria japonica TaxID=3369 RepID=UPI0027DA92B7|nr:uncharacterized protein LOC131079997 [Cryptomeria japonica]
MGMLLCHFTGEIPSAHATMLQLHPIMDARRFSSFAMHFNSYGKGGGRQSKTKLNSLMGKCCSRRGTVMMSKKDPQLRSYIDEKGEEGLWSVIIPTYNRLPILSKCLKAVEEQSNYRESGIKEYEVIVVDDGSTDGTLHFLLSDDEGHLSCEEFISSSKRFPHVKVLQQNHGGAARARNLGFLHSRGSVIVFIDSDMVVTPDFLKDHARELYQCFLTDGDDATFTYGRVINTHNFENPQSEPFKLTDYSTAFFATGNIAISRKRLAQAAAMLGELSEGPFDTKFSEYGWEDLELGVRLKKGGAKLKHAPAAVGYHWHPAFSYDQLPMQIEQEKQRGRSAAYFYQKHPVYSVRYMIQMTPIHQMLWFLLTLGGTINEKTLEPFIKILVVLGQPQLAKALVSPLLNWYSVQATNEAIKKLK